MLVYQRSKCSCSYNFPTIFRQAQAFIVSSKMISHYQRLLDGLFRNGIQRGDIFWFLDKSVRAVTGNCVCFFCTLVMLMWCAIEVVVQLFLLSEKPSVGKILLLAPMFVTSVLVISTSLPTVIQRYTYKQIYVQYLSLSLQELRQADKPALAEIRGLFDMGIVHVVVSVTAVVICTIGYLPLDGFSYERSVWPVIQALKLIEDGPKAIIYIIAILNYMLIPAKAGFILFYGLHILHVCSMYCVSSILFRSRLKSIARNQSRAVDLLLIDQDWVAHELKTSIQQDIRLKRFSNLITNYFKWPFVQHAVLATIILSLLYYLNLFLNGGYSPIGSRWFMVMANITAFMYAHYSETYCQQIEQNRNVLYELPWYAFHKSNQKLVLIFQSNLLKSRFLTAGNLFDMNYSLLVQIMHKVFNVLTILGNLDPEGSSHKNI